MIPGYEESLKHFLKDRVVPKVLTDRSFPAFVPGDHVVESTQEVVGEFNDWVELF